MLITLTKVGLVLNIIGTIMIAFSFGKNLGEAYQQDKKGRKIFLASFLYPELFNWGLALLIIGFILQLLS
jgi:hypothetical protein